MENNSGLSKLGEKVSASSQYDPTQLEAIPREPRRVGYTAPMNGFDIWTAFEVSFLLKSGRPVFMVLRIATSAQSKNIFESKSLKLYLNSFNNTMFESKEEVIQIIEKDLSAVAVKDVIVKEVTGFFPSIEYNREHCIENMKENSRVKITDYEYTSSLLSTRSNYIDDSGKTTKSKLVHGNITMWSDLLRSNCEITSQPDWARIFINYVPDELLLDYTAILKYIISYRNRCEFHEPTCERIYNDLFELLKPKELTVICQYTRRGGIDINPYRSTREIHIEEALNIPKLVQQ